MLRKMVLVGVMVCLLARSALAAGSEKETSYWGDAGYGTLAAVANLFYMPAKVLYAGVGIVTGGLAYVLTVGDVDTAEKVWSPSLGGTYVLTPPMMHGAAPILFSGVSYSKD